MVHVRRKFIEVFDRNGSAIAEEAIKRIATLYRVEKAARYKSVEERVALRQEKAQPIFDDLEAWLQLQLPKISGKSSVAEVIRYALGRMNKVDPEVWFRWVLARVADHKMTHLDELMPWNWSAD